jgi:transposase InsO family protein
VLQRSIEPSQYTAIRYSDRLSQAGISASIGSTGDSYDNAMAEALNGISDRALFVKQSLPVGETILWVLGVRWWLAIGRGRCSFECGGALK